ncbi:unnamed protein product, partial [Prorocentrum cordatum]
RERSGGGGRRPPRPRRRGARRGAACARSGPPHAAIPRAARRERPCLQRGEGLRPKSRARACARHGGEVGVVATRPRLRPRPTVAALAVSFLP